MSKPVEIKDRLSKKNLPSYQNLPIIIREFSGDEVVSLTRQPYVHYAKDYITGAISLLKRRIVVKEKKNISTEQHKENLIKLIMLDKHLGVWFFKEPSGFMVFSSEKLKNPHFFWKEELKKVISLVVFYLQGEETLSSVLKKLKKTRSKSFLSRRKKTVLHAIKVHQEGIKKIILARVSSDAIYSSIGLIKSSNQEIKNHDFLERTLESAIVFQDKNEKKKIAFSGFQHQTPILSDIHEESVRNHIATDNLRSLIKLYVKKIISQPGMRVKHANGKGIIEIPLSTVALLSVDEPSKKKLLIEARDAYRSLDQRIILIEIDGTHYTIRLHSVYLNLGNNHKPSRLLNRINRRGLNNLCQQFRLNVLPEAGKMDKKLQHLVDSIIEVEQDEMLHRLKAQLRYYQIKNRSLMVECYAALDVIGEKIQNEEHLLSFSSDRVQIKKNRKHVLRKKRLKREWGQLKRKVCKHELTIDNLNEKIYLRRRNLYNHWMSHWKKSLKKTTKKNRMFVQLYLELFEFYEQQEKNNVRTSIKYYKSKFLQVLTKWSYIEKNGDFSLERYVVNIFKDSLRLPFYVCANAICYMFTGKNIAFCARSTLKKQETDYCFTTRFLALQEQSGTAVDWFCGDGMSMCDVQNENINALYYFIEQFKRLPNSSEEDEKSYKECLNTVRKYSPHRWCSQAVFSENPEPVYAENSIGRKINCELKYFFNDDENAQKKNEKNLQEALRRVACGMHKPVKTFGRLRLKEKLAVVPFWFEGYASLVRRIIRKVPERKTHEVQELQKNRRLSVVSVIGKLKMKLKQIKGVLKKVV